MKILFITHDTAAQEPLGLEYVAAAASAAGHAVSAATESTAVAVVRSEHPDVVAFQVITGDQLRWGAVARSIRSVAPKTKIVFGGPHFLFFSKDGAPEADLVLRGEAEHSFVPAIEGREWKDLQAEGDLDSLHPPARSIFYNHRFPQIARNPIRNFIACRGCPYKCTYCYNSNTEWLQMVAGKNRLRYHSPEWIVEDARRVFHEHGGELASFQDDIFGVDIAWLEKFAKLWAPLRIPFFAQLRPLLITEDRVKLLKAAGIHVASFAIESGVEETRTRVLDRKEPNETILRGCELLHKYGIKFRVQNLLGLPVDDPLDDALKTLEFNMKMRPSLSWCSLLQAYPGTAIADYVVKLGLVKSMDELLPMVNANFFGISSLPIKNRDKIERLHKFWSAVVRWPALLPLVKILIHAPIPEVALNWIFNRTKQYINQREYWRVGQKTIAETHFALDRLGGELKR